jgi:hypothetical protein
MRNWKSSALAVVALALNLVVADAASAQDFGYDTGGLNTYSIAPVVSNTVPVTQNTEPNANVVMWDVDVVTGDSLLSSGKKEYISDNMWRRLLSTMVEKLDSPGIETTITCNNYIYYDSSLMPAPYYQFEECVSEHDYDHVFSTLDSAMPPPPIYELSSQPHTSRSDPLNDFADVATNIDDWPLPNGPAIASSIDNLSDDEDNASVPEPSLIIGTMLALAAGIKVLKRGHEQ